MNNFPLISVIIPTYNRTSELERALNGVLQQTYENLEIIVVDDNSIEKGSIVGIINSFNDPRIILLQHAVNRGGGAARNSGIVSARGDYIAFLDSDDEWKSDKIEKQLSILDGENVNDAVVYCQSEIIYRSKPILLPPRGIKEKEKVCDYLFLNGGFLPTPSLLVSAKLAKSIMFNPELRRHQDYDFLLRIDESEARFYFISEPLVIIHWEGERGYHSKGWSPDLTEKFANDYKKYFSKKAYNNFVFMNLINSSAVCYSKMYSLRKLGKVNIFQVKFINILKYIKNLFKLSYEK